jgi:hypothetical protein
VVNRYRPIFYERKGDFMREILRRISKLIDVKSLISLLFAVCLSVAFLKGNVDVKDYLTVCTMAFTFFFSYQNNKKANIDKED